MSPREYLTLPVPPPAVGLGLAIVAQVNGEDFRHINYSSTRRLTPAAFLDLRPEGKTDRRPDILGDFQCSELVDQGSLQIVDRWKNWQIVISFLNIQETKFIPAPKAAKICHAVDLLPTLKNNARA